MVGIVVDPDGDLAGVEEVRLAVFGAGMVPLLIGPHGGTVGGMAVQRTFATARSVEFDVVLLAGAPAPAPDALPARDAKAGAADTAAIDPRVVLLVEEAYRHCKVIGAWGAGATVLEAAGVTGTPGIVRGDGAAEVLERVQEQMAYHRAWERFAS
jgi:catalase